jgi:hypothetical protein
MLANFKISDDVVFFFFAISHHLFVKLDFSSFLGFRYGDSRFQFINNLSGFDILHELADLLNSEAGRWIRLLRNSFTEEANRCFREGGRISQILSAALFTA